MTRVAASVRRRWWVVLIVVALVCAVGLGVALSLNQLSQTEPLMLQADALPVSEARLVRQREILQFQVDNLSKIWTTLVQAVVGVVLTVGAVATWRNLKATQDKLEVDREAQITNRFTQAIGQLGAELKDGQPNLVVRLGGIYALERIARDSHRDHWTIMEVLTAYVRQNARWTSDPSISAGSPPELSEGEPQAAQRPTPVRTDIQAIVTVLGRRVRSVDRQEPARLNLRETDLREVDLTHAHLERADLSDAHLEGADLGAIHLEDAHLVGTQMQRAMLVNAHLERANLSHAHLEEASFTTAHLEGAHLWSAHMDRTQCSGAHFEGARLSDAQLKRAQFLWAHLDGADFRGAELDDAHLLSAHGLTADQVRSFGSRKGTLLPPHLAHLEVPAESSGCTGAPQPPTWLVPE
jgi:hypothetical protein